MWSNISEDFQTCSEFLKGLFNVEYLKKDHIGSDACFK